MDDINKEIAIRYSAFPSELKDDITFILNTVPNQYIKKSGANAYNIYDIIIKTCDNDIRIPYRLYEVDLADETWNMLNEKQRIILACLYTRHCNGYIREKYLRQIIYSQEPWVIPFRLLLLGEYVIEISDVILKNIHNLNHTEYLQFYSDNKDFMKRLRSRILTYWHIYYSSHCSFDSYPPIQVLNFLDANR